MVPSEFGRHLLEAGFRNLRGDTLKLAGIDGHYRVLRCTHEQIGTSSPWLRHAPQTPVDRVSQGLDLAKGSFPDTLKEILHVAREVWCQDMESIYGRISNTLGAISTGTSALSFTTT